MTVRIKNARIYDAATRSFREGGLVIEDGKVVSHEASEDAADFGGDFVVPGLLDIHTHGRNEIDYISATVDEMKMLRRRYAEQGVTTVAPSLASDTLENMLAAVERIREAGYDVAHIEGRYLNPAKRGAHAAPLLSPLTASEVARFVEKAGGMHLHFTAAFELDTDFSFLAAVKACGATASLGHTNATYEEAKACIEHGLDSFTHFFNTMPPLHHRAGGAVAAGLLSDAYVELICDGFHLAPETVAIVHRCKRPERVILVTDSMMGTGCADGDYSIGGLPVVVKDGKAYTVEGAIAGSTLELLQGVKNYASFCGISFAEALGGATANPAAMLGMTGYGRLEVGCRGNLLRLSSELALKEVYLGGERLS